MSRKVWYHGGYHYGEVTYVRAPRTARRDTAEETSRRAVQGHNSLPAGSLYLNLIVARSLAPSFSLSLSGSPELGTRTGRERPYGVKRTVGCTCERGGL